MSMKREPVHRAHSLLQVVTQLAGGDHAMMGPSWHLAKLTRSRVIQVGTSDKSHPFIPSPDLNASECSLPHDQIRFLPTTSQGVNGTETNLTVAQLPALANHPRVRGPKFVGLRIGAGHRLDWRSSGVFVLAVGSGNKQLSYLQDCHLTKEYTVHGSFGTATEDFSDTGRLIEKTTYDHITLDRLERIIAVIQGSHQKALITYSGIDLKSQAAYELACRGMLRPLHKSPPIITGIRCSQFFLPNFTLEVQCVHETQQYLRKIIHEIGLELKSSAVCTSVRRTRDGVFTLDDALIRTDWKLQQISSAVQRSQPRVAAALREDSWRHTAHSGTAIPERCPSPHRGRALTGHSPGLQFHS